MTNSLIQFFYPNIKNENIEKSKLFALTLFFILSAYWILKLLKDIVIFQVSFPTSLGYAIDEGAKWVIFLKMLSPFFVFLFILIYTKLVDLFNRQKLYSVLISFYLVSFTAIASILWVESTYGAEFVGATLLKYFGAFGYLITESLGSIIVVNFWSIAISGTNTEEAKSGFPFMLALGQTGSLLGSFLILQQCISVWFSFIVGVILLLCSAITLNKIKMDHRKDRQSKKADYFGGIKLLFQQPYFLGIFAVSTFYEAAGAIIDYQLKMQAFLFPGLDFKWFMGVFGVSINLVTLLIALLGTSRIIHKFGTKTTILIYPISFAISLGTIYGLYLYGASSTILLWGTLAVMLVVKAVAYSVNTPVKDMMYIPTSKDAKFKTKALIDTFGTRAADMAGAKINSLLGSLQNLMMYGSLISLGIIGIWFAAAIYLGRKNASLIKNQEVIG